MAVILFIVAILFVFFANFLSSMTSPEPFLIEHLTKYPVFWELIAGIFILLSSLSLLELFFRRNFKSANFNKKNYKEFFDTSRGNYLYR